MPVGWRGRGLVEGVPVQGWLVESVPVRGWVVEEVAVQGWLVEGAPVGGWRASVRGRASTRLAA